MTPADFRSWQAHMGLTVRAAADLLGVAQSTVQDWRTGTSRSTGKPIELPKMLALACAALAAGLGPWATSCRPALPQSGCSRPAPAPDCATRRRGKIPDLLL